MANTSKRAGHQMNNGQYKNEAEERANRKLKEFLQKAVNAEKAPDALRARIGKMIREK